MKILILGGAGFIGSHLADYYLARNHSVTGVDNLSTGKLENLSKAMENSKFNFLEADLLHYTDYLSLIEDNDIVYNLAAMVGMFNVLKHPINTLEVNIHITEKVLAAVSTLKKKPVIVIASSSEIYGSKKKGMKESDPITTPGSIKNHASYIISKLCNESSAMAYYKEKNLPIIVARIFNTIGPRQSSQYGMVVPRFIEQALQNEPLTIFSNGLQTRSFCDVRDLCNIFDQLTSTEKSIGKIINIGNDKDITILALAKKIIKITQSQSILTFQEYETIYGQEYLIVQNRKPDFTLLKSLINYSPEWTLDETIKNIMKHPF